LVTIRFHLIHFFSRIDLTSVVHIKHDKDTPTLSKNLAQIFHSTVIDKQVSEISSILLNVPLNSTKQQQNNQVAVKGHTTAGINILILIGTRD